ncbi:MAG: hypothetical protein P8Y00_06925 [Deltaproteobacteria bacterium]
MIARSEEDFQARVFGLFIFFSPMLLRPKLGALRNFVPAGGRIKREQGFFLLKKIHRSSPALRDEASNGRRKPAIHALLKKLIFS